VNKDGKVEPLGDVTGQIKSRLNDSLKNPYFRQGAALARGVQANDLFDVTGLPGFFGGFDVDSYALYVPCVTRNDLVKLDFQPRSKGNTGAGALLSLTTYEKFANGKQNAEKVYAFLLMHGICIYQAVSIHRHVNIEWIASGETTVHQF